MILKSGDIVIGEASAERYGVTKNSTTWIFVDGISVPTNRRIGIFGVGHLSHHLETHLDICHILQRYIIEHYKRWIALSELEYSRRVSTLREFFPKEIFPIKDELIGFNYFEVDGIDFRVLKPIVLPNRSLAMQHLKKLGD